MIYDEQSFIAGYNSCLATIKTSTNAKRVDLQSDSLEEYIDNVIKQYVKAMCFDEEMRLVYGTNQKGYIVFIPDEESAK